MLTYIKWFCGVILLSITAGCTTGKPNNVQPVTNFDINRYLGQWYEIARLGSSVPTAARSFRRSDVAWISTARAFRS